VCGAGKIDRTAKLVEHAMVEVRSAQAAQALIQVFRRLPLQISGAMDAQVNQVVSKFGPDSGNLLQLFYRRFGIVSWYGDGFSAVLLQAIDVAR
jgi:hypothetical protein